MKEKMMFSLPKLIQDQGEKFYEMNKGWINECKNKEVYFSEKKPEWGVCAQTFYEIHRNWCEPIVK